MDKTSRQKNQADFKGAIAYAIARLENELPTALYYHNLAHTRDDVMVAAVRLAQSAQIELYEIQLLEVAAAFHDIGFVIQSTAHELIGTQIAGQILPGFDFTLPEIERIQGMIMATRLPQSPNNLLEQLLSDADLDVLGREEDFFDRNNALRHEMVEQGLETTDQDWYLNQLIFLQNHRYFTDVAKQLRNTGKERNIARIKERLHFLDAK